MVNDEILSKEELEALLTPEELEAFKMEQKIQLEREHMLNPGYLLIALHELNETVARLNTRVEYLENQLNKANDQESYKYAVEEPTKALPSIQEEHAETLSMPSEESHLISRLDRHRDRKKSLISKLLK
ncbi:MAG: hypothetical protein JWM44_3239 [Bacilli bacterium]|nr:hypothetical protein [Bacilli bacterium]